MVTSKPVDMGAARFSRMTDEQNAKVFEACLRILERTGVNINDPGAFDLFRRGGAITGEGNRVRIPPAMVERAISTAPKQIDMYDRNGELAMEIGGGRTFYGPGSDCLTIVDHRTWERREPVLRDVEEGITLADALENINFVMSMFLPVDIDKEIADRYQMEVMLNRTTKPIFFVTYDVSGCVDVVKMAEIVAGGSDALRRKPYIACYINATSGLSHNRLELQKMIYLAKRGIPATYVPGIMAGANGPVTVAGSTTIGLAGALVGLVLAQLAQEGAPVFMPGCSAMGMDMKSSIVVYTGPDHQGVNQSTDHYLGLPIFGVGGACDSKTLDQQSAAEAALTLMMNTIVGGNIVHDVGYLESGRLGCLAELAVCDEIITWIKRSLAPVDVSDEALALDLIELVGPDGGYVDSEHTLHHFREQWHPRLFDRNKFEGWMAKGGKSLAERAAVEVDRILKSHTVDPLPKDVAAEVHQVVEMVEAQARRRS